MNDLRTFELRIELQGIVPPIWRVVTVPAQICLDELHYVIQAVMGWRNSHLHEFRTKRGARYGVPGPDSDDVGPKVRPEDEYALEDLLKRPNDSISYCYDFGDNWRHLVTLRAIRSGPCEPPRCLAGERACPPEDCGGCGGYERVLAAIAAPDAEDHRELVDWIPSAYDPAVFHIDEINARLTRGGLDGLVDEYLDAEHGAWEDEFGDPAGDGPESGAPHASPRSLGRGSSSRQPDERAVFDSDASLIDAWLERQDAPSLRAVVATFARDDRWVRTLIELRMASGEEGRAPDVERLCGLIRRLRPEGHLTGRDEHRHAREVEHVVDIIASLVVRRQFVAARACCEVALDVLDDALSVVDEGVAHVDSYRDLMEHHLTACWQAPSRLPGLTAWLERKRRDSVIGAFDRDAVARYDDLVADGRGRRG